MNIAVLSDIHSNHIAFETCLKYLETQNIDAYCLLDDYVGVSGVGRNHKNTL